MAISLTQDHEDLAQSVAAFAQRHAPIDTTRAGADELAKGATPSCWAPLVSQGLHAVHLPEEVGGDGAGLLELAIIVEQLGQALVPGGYLPTLLTSAVLTQATATEAVSTALRSLAEGAVAALVHDATGLTATADPSGWVLRGRSVPVLGLPGADVVVVAARDTADQQPRWFVLRAEQLGAAVHTDAGVDLTRSLGHLELDGLTVPGSAVLEGLTAEAVDVVVLALLAAEASGIARWCLNTAVEHVKVRHQFGQALGTFQAVQHKAAHLLLRAEKASASAWDAARALEHEPAQQRLAAAQAAVTALPAAVEAAVECVTLLGAVGFTWEHDVHLYWRRAMSIRAIAGADAVWQQRLGVAAQQAARDFSIEHDTDSSDFRAQVSAALDEVAALPADVPAVADSQHRVGPRRQRLAELGYLGAHWPKPYGIGASTTQQLVLTEELRARSIQAPDLIIGEYAMAALVKHGTQEQKDRFVHATLRGDLVWCQLFSEPGAGSDLAGLSTRATKVEGGWKIQGQKVWNTMAHQADWGILLARTDPDAPKHKGISYFLVDMTSPGITVRPLKQATGRAEFNEVFLDEVFVPDANLVGEPGGGWKITLTTLATERLNMATTRLGHGTSAHLREAIGSGALAAPEEEVLRVLGRLTAAEITLGALNLRGMFLQLLGRSADANNSVTKVSGALAQRSGSEATLALLGPAGALATSPGNTNVDHLGLPAILFGGGTVEIQLNILAQRVLGLPRA
ncbi:acyl-CoA dehydrogenase [Rhodococcus sp. X156]|uniref:acyl-CoA dehydrogenase n=1 Tax=Rhodococcus sp. X156 TaxID=2499145 RepID=UPI000FDBF311|nr:acyl-CoA dehydrogenase [Rhodococcus sp. X156]